MEARQLSTADSETFRLALRVRHPSMDPAVLSRAFKIEPEHSFRAGSARSSRSGIAVSAVHSESYWLGRLRPIGSPLDPPSRGDPQSAQRQIIWALSIRFLKSHADLLRSIRAGGGEVTLLITADDEGVDGFVLEPEASRLLGNLGVAIEFELSGE